MVRSQPVDLICRVPTLTVGHLLTLVLLVKHQLATLYITTQEKRNTFSFPIHSLVWHNSQAPLCVHDTLS